MRIYRSNTGSSRTSFQFVIARTIGTATYDDTLLATELGEVLPTFDWDMPADNMIGLTAMGNGILAAFHGNTLCFSEPFVPYAWPVKYQLSTESPIVGLAAYAQSLVVATTRGLYVVTGVDPSAMVMEKLPLAQTCLSKRSMVPMMGGVVFASPDGLILVSPGGAANLTEQILTREEWQAYAPSTIRAWEIDGRYHAFYDNGTKAGLIFTLGATPSFVQTDQYAYAGYGDRLSDTLFIVKTGNVLCKWNAGSPMTFTWKSKEFRNPFGVNLGAARVIATSYPCTFKLYAGGVLKHTQTVTNASPFRLPSGFVSESNSIEISGTVKVTQVLVATGISELGEGANG